MNIERKDLMGNLLLALNIFIVFLLIFQGQLSLPVWTQSIGRLHPLLLHFPIVLLFLAYGLIFFRNRFREQAFVIKAGELLLYTGTILAGLTAVMGIFLSLESGYDPEIIRWHEWGGVAVFFLSSLIYISRNKKWNTDILKKISVSIAAIILVIAGHNGGELTHGADYVTAPLKTPVEIRQVAFEDAEVFADLVKPVFEAKCRSCHNNSKLKGGLSLQDSITVIRGGKTGKLFISGSPVLSLLMERIHLPESDKKHMPPAGKPQLTPAEQELLYWWIRDSAKFTAKIASYPPTDSFRNLAVSFFPIAEEQFGFAAADESEIEKLNNDFTRVVPIAINSPALAVSIFQNPGWSSKSLEDLKTVKDQVISLDVNKVHVKNEDLKIISSFVNLRKLNLNFTQVSADGLLFLMPLLHLEFLSLAGTKMEPKQLQRFLDTAKSLKEVAFWNSGVGASDIQILRQNNKHLMLDGGPVEADLKVLQLNKVQMKNISSVFSDKIVPELKHPIAGVEIRYTLDGKDPDSISALLYNGKDPITSSSIIKAKAFKSGWLSSDIAEFRLLKSRHKPDSVKILTAVHERFPALGAASLFDGNLGGYSQYGDRWIGFSIFPMELLLTLQNSLTQSITVDFLCNPAANIFPPQEIEVLGGDDQLHLVSIKKKKLSPTAKDEILRLGSVEIDFEPKTFRFIKIIVTPQLFPAWHKAKGKTSLLLVDEVLLN